MTVTSEAQCLKIAHHIVRPITVDVVNREIPRPLAIRAAVFIAIQNALTQSTKERSIAIRSGLRLMVGFVILPPFLPRLVADLTPSFVVFLAPQPHVFRVVHGYLQLPQFAPT